MFVLGTVCIARLWANASPETCPAAVSNLYPSHGSALIFGFQIEAATARTVTGDLAVETDRGWYRVPFAGSAVTKTTRHYATRANPKPVASAVFASPTIYARFPKPVKILNGWVEKASAAGDTGWGAGLPFTCYPTPPAYAGNPLYERNLDRDDAAPMTLAPAAGASLVAANPAAPIESTSCAHPFVDARAVKLVPPSYPYTQAMPDGISFVNLTLLPDGSLADATVYQSSGDVAFDVAALEAARRSTFLPKIVYCRPGIGEYLFRAEFRRR